MPGEIEASAPIQTQAQSRGLSQGRFSGRTEFQQLVRDALAAAAREGWPELILSDANFADWPLGERAMVAGQYLGLALLAGLMGLAFYNDILHLVS